MQPVGFMFYGEHPAEVLAFEFLEDRGKINDSPAHDGVSSINLAKLHDVL